MSWGGAPSGGHSRVGQRFYVLDLLPECEDEDLRTYFGQFGKVLEAAVYRERDTGLSRHYASIRMLDPTVTEQILGDTHHLWGHPITVADSPGDDLRPDRHAPDLPEIDLAPAEPDEQRRGPHPEEATNKFFVGNVKTDIVEEDLRAHFTKFGEVVEVVVKHDRETGHSKNFAFVTFSSALTSEARARLLEEPHVVKDTTIRVQEARGKAKPMGKGKAMDPWGCWAPPEGDYLGWPMGGGGKMSWPAAPCGCGWGYGGKDMGYGFAKGKGKCFGMGWGDGVGAGEQDFSAYGGSVYGGDYGAAYGGNAGGGKAGYGKSPFLDGWSPGNGFPKGSPYGGSPGGGRKSKRKAGNRRLIGEERGVVEAEYDRFLARQGIAPGESRFRFAYVMAALQEMGFHLHSTSKNTSVPSAEVAVARSSQDAMTDSPL